MLAVDGGSSARACMRAHGSSVRARDRVRALDKPAWAYTRARDKPARAYMRAHDKLARARDKVQARACMRAHDKPARACMRAHGKPERAQEGGKVRARLRDSWARACDMRARDGAWACAIWAYDSPALAHGIRARLFWAGERMGYGKDQHSTPNNEPVRRNLH